MRKHGSMDPILALKNTGRFGGSGAVRAGWREFILHAKMFGHHTIQQEQT